MLLEEAISSIETEAVEVTTTVGKAFHGLQTKHQFCGVGIGSEGLPFLVLFNQMEPDAPKGARAPSGFRSIVKANSTVRLLCGQARCRSSKLGTVMDRGAGTSTEPTYRTISRR